MVNSNHEPEQIGFFFVYILETIRSLSTKLHWVMEKKISNFHIWEFQLIVISGYHFLPFDLVGRAQLFGRRESSYLVQQCGFNSFNHYFIPLQPSSLQSLHHKTAFGHLAMSWNPATSLAFSHNHCITRQCLVWFYHSWVLPLSTLAPRPLWYSVASAHQTWNSSNRSKNFLTFFI